MHNYILKKPKALKHRQIKKLISAYAKTAGLAKQAGYDGVELMGSEYRLKTAGLVIYGDNDERVLYSKIPFRIDRSGNND